MKEGVNEFTVYNKLATHPIFINSANVFYGNAKRTMSRVYLARIER